MCANPQPAIAQRSLRVAIDAVGIRGGGGATVLEDFLESFPRIRPKWAITAFVLSEKNRDFHLSVDGNSVKVKESNLGDSGLGRLVWQNIALPQQLRRIKADVVFSIANSGAVFPVLPQVVYLHQSNAFRGPAPRLPDNARRFRLWAIGVFANWSGRHSHAVIVQTEAMKEAVIECYPALSKNLVVIPGGARDIARSESSLAMMHQRLGEELGPIISYVSLPSDHKNHETLLGAWPLVRDKFPGARLALTLGRDVRAPYLSMKGGVSLGGGCLGDLPAGVIDLGVLSRNDVRSLYVCSDLMVFPSMAESFGLPLVEAMAEGCPVAASDLPYAHEVLGDAGAYFDASSSTSIAKAITNLLCDYGRRKQMIHLGLERSKYYRLDVITERVAKVLEAAATMNQESKPTS